MKDHYARLYQRLLICQEIHLSHQQLDCYQMLFCISCIIESSWAIHESPGEKPDCEKVKSLLL